MLVVDNFAGGGGASTGIEAALGRPIDYAINHDAEAIAMHRANHPATRHLQTSVWDVNPRALVRGRSVELAWFSPDCTFHSKARGGKPFRDRDAARRRRGLAWLIPYWIKATRPRIVMLENVEEFRDWGPLLKNGRICPKRRGSTFRRWIAEIENLGYTVDMRELRASAYGAPTTRKRLFVVARCDGGDIVFPEATHGPGLLPFATAADCIDWSIPCPSIFDRARPLAPATMARIARGLDRFVLNNPRPFIVGIDNKSNGARDAWSSAEPLRTVTTENRFAIVAPSIVSVAHGYSGGRREYSAIEPLTTVQPGGNKHALVAAFLAQHNTGMTGHPADRPLSTITSRGTQQQLVTAHLLTNTTRHTGRDMGEPVPTITTGNHHALVASHLMKLRHHSTGQDMRDPLDAITAGGNHFAEVRAFLLSYFGTQQAPDLFAPAPTVRTHAHLGLVTVHGQPYRIADIGMRMLSPRELFRAQSFGDDYVIEEGVTEEGEALKLTKTAQVRMCGNSVPPKVAEALVRANVVEQPASAAA